MLGLIDDLPPRESGKTLAVPRVGITENTGVGVIGLITAGVEVGIISGGTKVGVGDPTSQEHNGYFYLSRL